MNDDLISRQAAIETVKKHYRVDNDLLEVIAYEIETLPPAQPGQRNARVFQGIVVEYPSISAYPEYEGKPYFSIKYTVNGQEFIGYGTYKAEALSEYLKEYFMPPAQPGWIPVTEKCPEIGQIVLCSLKTRHYYGRIHVCKYRAADKYYDHSYFDWDHNGFPDVVAWMPLPKPWEGEKS